jgi:hypothetical protein
MVGILILELLMWPVLIVVSFFVIQWAVKKIESRK